jgi:glycosyltransferase involved in cell wall biosynthesis
MRVALVTHKVGRGDGQARVNYEVAREAARQGIGMTLLASSCDPDVAALDGVRWVPVPVPYPTELVRNQVFAARTARWLRAHRNEYDLLHVNGFITWSAGDVNASHFVHSAWLASPYRRTRLSLRSAYHSFYAWLNAHLEVPAYRSARMCVAVSDLVADQLEAIGIPRGRIVTIPNGVDLNEFCPGPPCRRELGLPEDVPLALFVGDIRRDVKGLDTVLRALTLCPDWHLAVAGFTEGSPYPALACRLGLGSRVAFLGYRSDMLALYRSADVIVAPPGTMPSRAPSWRPWLAACLS